MAFDLALPFGLTTEKAFPVLQHLWVIATRERETHRIHIAGHHIWGNTFLQLTFQESLSRLLLITNSWLGFFSITMLNHGWRLRDAVHSFYQNYYELFLSEFVQYKNGIDSKNIDCLSRATSNCFHQLTNFYDGDKVNQLYFQTGIAISGEKIT